MCSQDDPCTKALSYGDVVLRSADIALLEGPHWLNDQIIAFFFEYAASEKYKDLASCVLLLPGAMSFLLANSAPSEAQMILEPLQVQQKDLVILAVNDNPDVEAAGGGSHWSLLAYSRSSCAFRHYDSLSTRSSRAAATKLYRAVQGSLAPGLNCPLTHVANMPQQKNGYDCGIYVLLVTDKLCCSAMQAWREQGGPEGGRLALDLETEEKRFASWCTPDAVSLFRSQLLELVLELQRRQERRADVVD